MIDSYRPSPKGPSGRLGYGPSKKPWQPTFSRLARLLAGDALWRNPSLSDVRRITYENLGSMDSQAVQHLLHWMDKFSTASPRKGDVPLVCSIRHERILSTSNTSDGPPAKTIRAYARVISLPQPRVHVPRAHGQSTFRYRG